MTSTSSERRSVLARRAGRRRPSAPDPPPDLRDGALDPLRRRPRCSATTPPRPPCAGSPSAPAAPPVPQGFASGWAEGPGRAGPRPRRGRPGRAARGARRRAAGAARQGRHARARWSPRPPTGAAETDAHLHARSPARRSTLALQIAEAVLGRELAGSPTDPAPTRCAVRWSARARRRARSSCGCTPRTSPRSTPTLLATGRSPCVARRARSAARDAVVETEDGSVDADHRRRPRPGPGGARPMSSSSPTDAAGDRAAGRRGPRRAGRLAELAACTCWCAGSTWRSGTWSRSTADHGRCPPRWSPAPPPAPSACRWAPPTACGSAPAVRATGGPLRVGVGEELAGRVLDGLGRPIDGGPPLARPARVAVERRRPHALARPASTGRSASACAPWTPSCPAAAASGSASWPAPASASPPCSR